MLCQRLASSLQPVFENLTPTTRKRCATTSRWNRRWASPRRGSTARSARPGRGNGPRRPLAARRGCCRDVEQRALSSCRSADAQRVSHAGAPTIMRLVCQRTAREFRSGPRLFRWRRSSAQAGEARCRDSSAPRRVAVTAEQADTYFPYFFRAKNVAYFAYFRRVRATRGRQRDPEQV